MRQPEWDKFEAAILLKAYIDSRKRGEPLTKYIKQVSNDLRQMALNRGLIIDDIYRNINGISLQMYNMGMAYRGLPGKKHYSMIFKEVTNMYHSDRKAFEHILAEAREMIEKKAANQIEFLKQLAANDSQEEIAAYKSSYKEIERFFTKIGTLKQPLLETTDIETLDNIKRMIKASTAFALIHGEDREKLLEALDYYIEFLSAKDEQEESGGIKEKLAILPEPEPKKQGFLAGLTQSLIGIPKRRSYAQKSAEPYPKPVQTDEDKRLLKKYPIAYNRTYDLLKTLNEHNRNEITLIELHNRLNRCVRSSHLEDILDNASWAKRKGRLYSFSHNADCSAALLKGLEDRAEEADKSKPESLYKHAQPLNRQSRPRLNERYERVLRENFKMGFNLKSPIDLRRFKILYRSEFESELTASDDTILKDIRRGCVIYDNRAFIADTLLSQEVKNKLFDYISDSFASNRKVIYFAALFNQFQDLFISHNIHNSEMLRSYLEYFDDGSYHVGTSYISLNRNVVIDPAEEIRQYLKEISRPAGYNEIFSALQHIPEKRIKSTLASCSEFIYNKTEQYFHADILHLTNQQLEDIADIIKTRIEQTRYVTGNELYDDIKRKHQDIIDDNPTISALGFRNSLSYRLSDRFRFKGNVISDKGANLTMQQVWADYCKTNSSFTIADLNKLKEKLDSGMYFEVVYKNSLRISRNQFVSRRQARFKVEETDAVLNSICLGDYISLKQINNFMIFPDAGFAWNSFLLEHYAAQYSKMFMLINNGFNSNKSTGAIVRRSSGIDGFIRLVIDAIANSGIELTERSALDFLFNEGYVSSRRLANIRPVLIEAAAQRNMRGAE
jgi:hypothetical protein